MNLEGQKISGSRNWAVWGRDFLSRYDPDALRYYLTINMPENKDSDWDWKEFVARNNNELVATWGNLANRVLSFCFRTWDGRVPAIDLTALRPSDLDLLAYIDGAFDTVGKELEVRPSACCIARRPAARITGESVSRSNRALDHAETKQSRSCPVDLHGPQGHRLAQDHIRAIPAVHLPATA